jgi:hypothetical protein
LAGNFDIEYPTAEQKTSVRNLIKAFRERFGVPFENIRPHRFVCGRATGIVKTPTINGLPAYKTCYGSKLSDDYFTKGL